MCLYCHDIDMHNSNWLPIFTVQINTNGVVSFGSPFTVSISQSFPRRTTAPLIAVFWDNYIDIGRAGDIFYRETSAPDHLQAAADFINARFSAAPTNFQPTYLFIVTWSNVAGFDRGSAVCTVCMHAPMHMP